MPKSFPCLHFNYPPKHFTPWQEEMDTPCQDLSHEANGWQTPTLNKHITSYAPNPNLKSTQNDPYAIFSAFNWHFMIQL